MDNNNRKKTIYDGIRMSTRGRDLTVLSLSLLLLIALIAAFIGGK